MIEIECLCLRKLPKADYNKMMYNTNKEFVY